MYSALPASQQHMTACGQMQMTANPSYRVHDRAAEERDARWTLPNRHRRIQPPDLRIAIRLIALARSASSAMLNRPALRDAALAALPPDRRSSVRDYCAE
ncbi:MAG: hypothetical protein ACRDOA_23035, partial [Streptosporangiaceae bacterium]